MNDTAPEWWTDHRNLATLADHMLAEGDEAEQIVYMLSKPWAYEDEFRAAQEALA